MFFYFSGGWFLYSHLKKRRACDGLNQRTGIFFFLGKTIDASQRCKSNCHPWSKCFHSSTFLTDLCQWTGCISFWGRGWWSYGCGVCIHMQFSKLEYKSVQTMAQLLYSRCLACSSRLRKSFCVWFHLWTYYFSEASLVSIGIFFSSFFFVCVCVIFG